MDNNELVKIIEFWKNNALENNLFPRDLTDKISLSGKEIVDITGSRRSGKSSILKLLIRKISSKDGWLYLNFEDPYFLEHNRPQIIEELLETKINYLNEVPKYLFFDEIQNINQWESAIRKLRDSGKYKIFVTGSSSKLLSRELSSLISGRHLSHTLYPLSFKEFLSFRKIELKNKKDIILQEKSLLKNFSQYLLVGGYPEIVLTENQELVKQYYQDIIQRDIIKRYDIREKELLEKMGIFLITNSGRTVSSRSIGRQYEIAFESVEKYLGYFEESFLLHKVQRFAYSLKTQQQALKKFYAIDTGLANAVSFKFSEDRGQMLENAVFLELLRRQKEIYYFQGNNDNETDFVAKNKKEIELFQVAWDVSDPQTKARETRGLKTAMIELGVNKGTILTYEQKEHHKIENLNIEIKPVFEWLLEGENIHPASRRESMGKSQK